MSTAQKHYDAYLVVLQAIEVANAAVKTARKEGEAAAVAARYATVGTMEEKFIAIRAAWVPFLQKIAENERAIAQHHLTSDTEWYAYRAACDAECVTQ